MIESEREETRACYCTGVFHRKAEKILTAASEG